MFQSDTMGSELRIMVPICLNHDRDEGQICQIVYLRAVIYNSIIVDLILKKPKQEGRTVPLFLLGLFDTYQGLRVNESEKTNNTARLFAFLYIIFFRNGLTLKVSLTLIHYPSVSVNIVIRVVSYSSKTSTFIILSGNKIFKLISQDFFKILENSSIAKLYASSESYSSLSLK